MWHNNIASFAPFLNGKILNIYMACMQCRMSFIDHIQCYNVVCANAWWLLYNGSDSLNVCKNTCVMTDGCFASIQLQQQLMDIYSLFQAMARD